MFSKTFNHAKRSANIVNFSERSGEKKPKLEHLYSNNSLQSRKNLPVFGVKRELIAEIQKYDSLIVIGETGSGKTTQIPQFLYEAQMCKMGMIGITQPRRIAAITVSKRVALEMDTKIGELVGYSVRFEDVTSSSTKLKYLTDGMLLREAMLDHLLMAYSVIVLDEAHERTVHTDVLFGIVKKAQNSRKQKNLKPLKILVMSATMDVDHFSKYFGDIPTVYLEGRLYPVEVFHASESQEDYLFTCLVTVFQIHQEAEPNHDILVFLTGQEEIEAMASNIRRIAKDLQGKAPPIKVYPLYSSLSSDMQMDVFRPTPVGMRKIVLSTNIAETSVTISGIKYVIDCGMVKIRTHHPSTGLDILKVERISQAQAWQRTGRAGRESHGFCYRTYSKQDFQQFKKNTVPEIQRCNLNSVVLQLLELGINPSTFDFMDNPPKEAIKDAIEQLLLLGAIDNVEDPELTLVGHQMAQFPLDPKYSKMIISAKLYNCVNEILSIIAILSGESVYVNHSSKREEACAVRQKFTSPAGDHITLLNIFRAYSNVTQKKQWCSEHFLHARNLNYASQVRSQLVQLCKRMNIPLMSCGQDTESVRKCLITGLFTNVAELQRERQYMTLGSKQTVSIHPSSVLFGTLPTYVIFSEVVQTGQCYLRQLSLVNPEWLAEIVPEYMRRHRLTFQSR